MRPPKGILYLLMLSACLVSTAQTNQDTIPESARLLSEYVQIPSISGNEKSAGEFFASLCREKGLYVRVFTDKQDSYNFAASLYPLYLNKPNIILLNHIDVVPEGDPDLWTYPPFSGTIADGFVWGRGAIDNKAMGIMQLLALAEFTGLAWEHDLPFNVTILSVSDEETGGEKGAELITDRYLAKLNPVVVYGEGGTGLRGVVQSEPDLPVFGIEVAQKRGLWIRMSAGNPVSGHGSVPPPLYPAKDVVFATSSILSARNTLQLTPTVRDMFHALGRRERGVRGLALRNIGFFQHLIGPVLRKDPLLFSLVSNTITLTILETSDGANNQIAQEAHAVFDCRLLPGTSQEAFMNEMKKRAGNPNLQFEIISSSPSDAISEKGHWYNLLESSVMKVFNQAMVAPMLFPAHNDNAFFRRHGIPAYGLLPAIMKEEEIESIHNLDERIRLESLEEGIMIYRELIRSALITSTP